MDYLECKECRHTAKRMPVLSYISLTDDFYQCEQCGQVSTLAKNAIRADAPVRFSAVPYQSQEART